MAKHVAADPGRAMRIRVKSKRGMRIHVKSAVSADTANYIVQMAAKGKPLAGQVPEIMTARNLNTTPNALWGFDTAIGLCDGKDKPDADTEKYQYALRAGKNTGPNGTPGSDEAGVAFDLGCALQNGITKASKGNVAGGDTTEAKAGALIVSGVADSGHDSDTKAAIVSQVTKAPLVKARAAQEIEKTRGFFASVLHFVGLSEFFGFKD